MDGQIRVKIDSRYGRLYNDLKNVVVGDFHELFFVCACLAYRHGRVRHLDKSRDDKFWSNTISPREWACYYAMVLEENGMSFATIEDDRAVISRMEEYASAGMDMLISEFLHDHLSSGGGDPQIEPGCAVELPRHMLHFIYEQMEMSDSSTV